MCHAKGSGLSPKSNREPRKVSKQPRNDEISVLVNSHRKLQANVSQSILHGPPAPELVVLVEMQTDSQTPDLSESGAWKSEF